MTKVAKTTETKTKTVVAEYQVKQLDGWCEIIEFELERIKVAKILGEPSPRNKILFIPCKHPTHGTKKPGTSNTFWPRI